MVDYHGGAQRHQKGAWRTAGIIADRQTGPERRLTQ